ncbi:hypothetical protein [Prauserella muralis]|uniref:Uncharacterized protein n=1 Tax=Prauserella muralis TaxID=588067 RepID=A0A2V4AYZ2_9PSEU|nr:hypothetical protein [Prauserella muralis]PXY21140.1 hypothetical protein BAY60_27115 [Prauserella muralis]TWE30228.1 hypothetical protein FHX69_2925 [Prauserella muralis]
MTDNELFVIVRRAPHTDTVELLAAFPDQGTAGAAADELGPGHSVLPVRMAPAGPVLVVHVWHCQVVVTVGQGWELREPARLGGASRIVLDADDWPKERVHVDEQAGDLEAAVHGQQVRYVNAYAPSAARARELAESEARRIAEA